MGNAGLAAPANAEAPHLLGTPCEVACRAVAMLELWGDAQRDLPLLPPTVFSECLDVRLGVPASLAACRCDQGQPVGSTRS